MHVQGSHNIKRYSIKKSLVSNQDKKEYRFSKIKKLVI